MSNSLLLQMLNSVHMDGAINECVVEIEKGVGRIRAVDLSYSVFVSVQAKVGGELLIDNSKLGILNIGEIIGVLGKSEGLQLKLSSDGKKLSCRIKGEQLNGSVNFRLGDPDVIPTKVYKEKEWAKIEEMLKSPTLMTFGLDSGFVASFLYFNSLFDCTAATFKVSGGKINVKGESKSKSSSFNLSLSDKDVNGKAIDSKVEVVTPVQGKILASVLRQLPREETGATLGVGEGLPLIIRQGESNMWLLSSFFGGDGGK